jgi:hypothetical protein
MTREIAPSTYTLLGGLQGVSRIELFRHNAVRFRVRRRIRCHQDRSCRRHRAIRLSMFSGRPRSGVRLSSGTVRAQSGFSERMGNSRRTGTLVLRPNSRTRRRGCFDPQRVQTRASSLINESTENLFRVDCGCVCAHKSADTLQKVGFPQRNESARRCDVVPSDDFGQVRQILDVLA